MIFIPVALECGHFLEGPARYEIPGLGESGTPKVECPEGCGWLSFVLEPEGLEAWGVFETDGDL